VRANPFDPSSSPPVPPLRAVAPALNRPNQFRESRFRSDDPSARKDSIDPSFTCSRSRAEREREKEREGAPRVIKSERNGNSVWLFRKLVSPFRRRAENYRG